MTFLRCCLGAFYLYSAWSYWQNPLFVKTLTSQWYVLAANHPFYLAQELLIWGSVHGESIALALPWFMGLLGICWLSGLGVRWTGVLTLIQIAVTLLFKFHTGQDAVALYYYQAIVVSALIWAKAGDIYGLDHWLVLGKAWIAERLPVITISKTTAPPKNKPRVSTPKPSHSIKQPKVSSNNSSKEASSELSYNPVLTSPKKPKNSPKVDPVLLQNSRVEVLLDD